MSINPPPSGSPVDDNQATPTASNKLTTPWLRWFQALTSLVNNLPNYTSANIVTPLTGFSITLTGSQPTTTLTPAGTLATGTVKLPPLPHDGQTVQVSTTQTITALTVLPSAGATLKNAPTTLAAGASFLYYYNTATTTWFRLL